MVDLTNVVEYMDMIIPTVTILHTSHISKTVFGEVNRLCKSFLSDLMLMLHSLKIKLLSASLSEFGDTREAFKCSPIGSDNTGIGG